MGTLTQQTERIRKRGSWSREEEEEEGEREGARRETEKRGRDVVSTGERRE